MGLEKYTEECCVCGYNTATIYLESEDTHNEGEGEYYCTDCYEVK